MKTDHQVKVERFMKLAGQEVPDKPTEPSKEIRILRAKLILEEAFETIIQGLGVTVAMEAPIWSDVAFYDLDASNFIYTIGPDEAFNLVDTVDGCCDLKVVTTGTLSACGVCDNDVQKLVDLNNLDKFGPGSYRREDGKWIKPPNHQPPRIAELLKEQE